MKKNGKEAKAPLVLTGTSGLDDILGGGLTPNRLYLVEGDPGAGKTTLALKFLLVGAERGEQGLYVTLSETKEELEATAESHGWSLDALSITELAPSEDQLSRDTENTMFYPSDVELSETTKLVLTEVERIKPSRIVFDSLSEMRLLAQNPLRYRRQILALKQFFVGRQCTVLLLDDRTTEVTDLQLQSIAHGVIELSKKSPEYGVMQRRLQVLKMRGKPFKAGYHDFIIDRGGLIVFPRLVAAEHDGEFEPASLSSGVQALNLLLGGGLNQGTSTLVMGPAGSGKSTIAMQFAVAVAERGERAAFFLFEESKRTFLERAAALGMDFARHITEGRVTLQQVDPGELSPGQFVHAVRTAAERDQAKVVVIDSLNGYLNAMPEVRFLSLQLHELLTYLGQRGVTTLLVMAQHGLIGSSPGSPVDASYLADTVILLRYFEAGGKVRQAISVVKKRSGNHERTIREFSFSGGGIQVGEPLEEFQGVLSGVPVYLGEPSQEAPR